MLYECCTDKCPLSKRLINSQKSCFIGNNLFATPGKKKGVNQPVATSRHRQTPVLKQQRSPHPKVQAFAFHCC